MSYYYLSMNRSHTPKKRPQKDWSRIRIKRALEDRDWSMRGLAKAHGRYPTSVSGAINHPWVDMEIIIADAIDAPTHEIWPSRWLGNDGRVLSVTERKSTRVPKSINVKDKRVA